MSEKETEQPPVTEPEKTPENTPPNPPQNQPPASPPNQSVDLEKFMTQLSALPETIAKSVKEAIGTPQAPQKPADPPAKETTKEPGEIKPEKAQPTKQTGTVHERFLAWWNK